VPAGRAIGLFKQVCQAFSTAAVKQLADHRAPPGTGKHRQTY
jgi:hypothetical protein